MMPETLFITSGDMAGAILAKAGLPGEVIVWHDILYDGLRNPGWPDESTMESRAQFLEDETGGGLGRAYVLDTMHKQYRKLETAGGYENIVLWFDACLFDQSMLVHILTCMLHKGIRKAELLCVDAFPGIVPYNGLGQLRPDQLASLYSRRRPVTDEQFQFAVLVDKAFANQDSAMLTRLSQITDAPLPWIPAAVARWLEERPDPATGLGRLESLALAAICAGCDTPDKIYKYVSAAETPPQYWGDTTLWGKINALAAHRPALVQIEGPADRLPQWKGKMPLETFKVKSLVTMTG